MMSKRPQAWTYQREQGEELLQLLRAYANEESSDPSCGYFYYYYYYIPHHEQVYTQEYDYMKLKSRGNTYNTVLTTAIKTRNI